MNENPKINLLKAQRELYRLLEIEKEKAWKLELKELDELKEQRRKQFEKIEYWTAQVLKENLKEKKNQKRREKK